MGSVFDNAKKEKWIQLRVSIEQKERIKQLAENEFGGNVTDYILDLIKEDEASKAESGK